MYDTSGRQITVGTKIGSLACIVVFSLIGGMIIKILRGEKICSHKFKNYCTSVMVPPLVGMIIFGCIARNAFGFLTNEHYPTIWADWIRQLSLSIILMRGGLELEFKGKGLTVLMLTIFP